MLHLSRSTRRCVAAAAATALTAAGVAALAATPAAAATNGTLAYGLTTDNKIISFRVGAPASVLSEMAITGLQAGEDVVGIDIRPATGQLVAVGSSSRIYVLDPTTGAVSAPQVLSTPLSGTAFGVDFNPVPDRLRVVSDAEQNLRINVDTGATTVDGALAYAASDSGAGSNPAVTAAGYTNSIAGTTTTSLFDIDTARDVLVLQSPPNNGTLTTVGALGVDTSTVAGLDIEPAAGTAYAVLQSASGSGLYTLSLSTGAATLVGPVRTTVEDLAVATPRFSVAASSVAEGTNGTVTVRRSGDTADAATVDYTTSGAGATEGTDFSRTTGTLAFGAGETSKTFSVPTASDGATEGAETFTVTLSNPSSGAVLSPAAATITIADAEAGKAYGLTASNQLVTFSVSSPGTISATVQITGLQAGEDLVGIDVRPAGGELFAVGSTSRLYVINPETGAATEKAALSIALSGTSFGVDFNPAVDRLRIVSNTGQNLRVVPDTGAVTVDGPLAYDAADPGAGTAPRVAAAGYTNNTAAATPTALINIDTARDVLVRQTPPNNGTLVTIGALGVAVSDTATVGLDISSQGGAAFAVLTPDGTTGVGLYRVDTSTGAVRLLGLLGNATVEDVALASVAPTQTPSPSPSASATPSASVSPTAAPGCAIASVRINTKTINATGLASVTVTGLRPGVEIELQGYSQDHFSTQSFANDRTPVDRVGTTDGTGSVTFNNLRPSSNTRVRARQVGCAFGSSDVINVRAQETLAVTRQGARTYTFSGRSIPAREGGLVVNLYRIVGTPCAAGVEPRSCPGEVFVGQARAQELGEQGEGLYSLRVTFPARDAGVRDEFVVKTGQDAQNAPGRSNARSLAIF